jgi:hypothetical protein
MATECISGEELDIAYMEIDEAGDDEDVGKTN